MIDRKCSQVETNKFILLQVYPLHLDKMDTEKNA